MYKSSVLKCFVDDDHCAVCRFIAGSRDIEDMLRVITIMDEKLAEEETILRDRSQDIDYA